MNSCSKRWKEERNKEGAKEKRKERRVMKINGGESTEETNTG